MGTLGFLLICFGVLMAFEAFFCTKTYLRLRGRYRLKHGWCPNCASSPPDPDCFVCHGTYNYGPKMKRWDREVLYRERYEKYL